MKAFIFAAGLGTRLFPFTQNKPKALVEIGGKPMLERLIENLIKQGVSNITINVHHFADLIENFIKEKKYFNIQINISDERSLLLDTGGGLKNAYNYLSGYESILIYNVDIFCDINISEFLNFHEKTGAIASLAVQNREGNRRLLFNENNFLCAWEDIKTKEIKTSRQTSQFLESLSFCGVHIIEPKLLNLIEEDGVFSIIDLYLRLAKEHQIAAYKFNSKYWFDLGKIENIKEAEKYI